MSTKQQNRRITKHIRIGEHLHRRLKLEAIKQGKTMSKLADEIIEKHFSHKDKSKSTVQENK